MPWLEPVLAGVGVFAVDQASKAFVLARPRYAAVAAPGGLLSIRCIVNKRGAALPIASRAVRLAAFALCAVLAMLALSHEPLQQSSAGTVGIALALGGIASNLVDSIARGGIVDFIAIGTWSICNIADIAILTGLALTLWALV